MYSPPDYSALENFVNPRLGPWTVFLYLHRQPILAAVKAASTFLRGRLLDVGCGNKPYASLLQCSEHVGVDVENSPHRRDRIDKIYDGKSLPFDDESFDSLLCTEVLEHCPNPQIVINEAGRVLKPGGYALVTVPMVIHHHEEPWDFQRLTRYGMEHMAAQAGFKVVWIQPRGGIYAVAIAASYCALSATLSRRPFIDFILWAIWPGVLLILWYERRRVRNYNISLGWQMLIQK